MAASDRDTIGKLFFLRVNRDAAIALVRKHPELASDGADHGGRNGALLKVMSPTRRLRCSESDLRTSKSELSDRESRSVNLATFKESLRSFDKDCLCPREISGGRRPLDDPCWTNLDPRVRVPDGPTVTHSL
jgi:hypothetical protein